MKENLNNALATLITEATQSVKSSIAFVQAELPDVIQQLLLWKTIDYLLGIFLGLLFIYVAYKCKQKISKLINDNEDDDYRMISYGICLITTAPISIICFISNLSNLIKITLAPKVWLIEYASKLLK